MKKFLLPFLVFFIALGAVYAQGSVQGPAQQDGLSALSMDAAVRRLAVDLSGKLNEERAGKIAFGEFIYGTSIPPFAQYWVNQLTEELIKLNGPYSVLSSGPFTADWIISGEIVELSDTIRVYTQLIRLDGRVIRAVFHSEFERNEYIFHMLSAGSSRSSSAPIARDAWESDSMDNPVTYEIGHDENAALMNRTLHGNSDEDFFLLLPLDNGRLVMETTGNTDTYMEFYNADTGEKLAQNDDGGSGTNARIRHNVEAGKRYIAKVRGYSSDETGSYGFKAYFQAQAGLQPDEYEPDNDSASAKWISIGTPQRHTFHDEDDFDWVKFEVMERGRYTIRARGVNSNRFDTYVELYDESMDSIGEDDDGGEELDSRLSRNLVPGVYYLRVGSFEEDPDQPYLISIERE